MGSGPSSRKPAAARTRKRKAPGADLSHIIEGLRPLAVEVSMLSVDPANARKHGERNLESIRSSLRRFGQQQPILVDGSGVCVAGSGRLEAARSLGWKHVAAAVTRLTGSDRTAFAIADNRIAELAKWDRQALTEQLLALQQDEDFDESVTGFEGEELDKMLDDALEELGDGFDELGGAPASAGGGAEVKDSYGVLVTCKSEADQRLVFGAMKKRGYRCRVMTM